MDKNFFNCPSCKEKSFVRVEKKFDGFKVIGKTAVCAMCGYEFKEGEEIPYIKEKSIFGDDKEKVRFCRDCRHYAEHPYTQKCMFHNREVTALDNCQDFEEKEKELD